MPHFEQHMADAFWAVDASSLCARRTQPIARSSGVTEAAMPPSAIVTVATCDDDDSRSNRLLLGQVNGAKYETSRRTIGRDDSYPVLGRSEP